MNFLKYINSILNNVNDSVYIYINHDSKIEMDIITSSNCVSFFINDFGECYATCESDVYKKEDLEKMLSIINVLEEN